MKKLFFISLALVQCYEKRYFDTIMKNSYEMIMKKIYEAIMKKPKCPKDENIMNICFFIINFYNIVL